MTIVLGVAGMIIETLPQFYGDTRHHFWFAFESVLIGIFSLEFLLRTAAHTESQEQFWSYARSPLTLLDLVSIIPFYVELGLHGWALGQSQKFTVLRLFRLLRLMRASQSSVLLKLSIEAMIVAVARSMETLVAIVCFLVFVIILASTAIYYVERGEWDPARRLFIGHDGEPSKFDSIPSTCWFVMEIVTTVGLGDVYPKTTAGRLISFPVMMVGLLIIALPSIVIGRNFADAWAWLRINRVGRRPSPGRTMDSPTPPDVDGCGADKPQQQQQPDLKELLYEVKRQNALLERFLSDHS